MNIHTSQPLPILDTLTKLRVSYQVEYLPGEGAWLMAVGDDHIVNALVASRLPPCEYDTATKTIYVLDHA